jgi:tRNA-Thr(GGU) m(6)t(6)A37 methyltransferase TsaA
MTRLLRPEPGTLTLEPIGVVRSPFTERVQAPRQPGVAGASQGTIELFSGKNLEHALADLESFRHLWILFWFHLNSGWRPKVLPPRSGSRRGVFATRSPHRPNPLGLSVVELAGIEGLVLHIRNLDMLDGTPVLDIKPYLPYADSVADGEHGWVGKPPDPAPSYDVCFSAEAEVELGFLRELGVDLRQAIEDVLGLGPAPHPYRRIRREGALYRLALKEWRIGFSVHGRLVQVHGIASGYRSRELAQSSDPALEAHRAFVRRFGLPAKPPHGPA